MRTLDGNVCYSTDHKHARDRNSSSDTLNTYNKQRHDFIYVQKTLGRKLDPQNKGYMFSFRLNNKESMSNYYVMTAEHESGSLTVIIITSTGLLRNGLALRIT